MNRVTFKHGFQATFTNTITRAVGPTTSTTARDLSDAVGPYVYLARNGNDANDGSTPALAKVTLTSAILALAALGRNTIHIISNGYTMSTAEQGYLTFALGGAKVMPANKGIQVELGYKARIRGVVAGDSLTLSSGGYINGVAVTNTFAHGIDVATGCTISWCYILGGTTTAPSSPNRGIVNLTGPITVQYSIVHAYFAMLLVGASDTINNCVFISPPQQLSGGGTVTPTIAMRCAVTAAGTISTFTRCVFVGWSYLVYQEGTIANLKTVTFNACTAYNTQYAVSTGATGVFTLNYNFCHILPVAPVFNYTTMSTAAPAGFTLVETNAISPRTPAMYRDYATAILPVTNTNVPFGFSFPIIDADGLRLQRRGASTSMGGTQYVNSPLIGLYTGPTDAAAPWDETVTGPVYSFDKTTIIKHPPKGLQLSSVLVNPVSLDDLLGNYCSNYDAVIRHFSFNFEYDIYPGHDDRIKLVMLLQDRNVMRMFLKGIDGNLFTTPSCDGGVDSPSATSGIFTVDPSDATRGTFVPFITDGNALIDTNWKGLELEMNGTEYYIESNNTTTFNILDLFSAGFPANGSYSFYIRSILVKPLLENLESSQENFTSFMFGGALREYNQLTGRAGSLAFEYSGHRITFAEATNLREIPA